VTGKENMTKRISVGVLGATGSVGQKFIQLLNYHPNFIVKEVAASERSENKKYCEAVNWILADKIPDDVSKLKVKSVNDKFTSKLLFSALDASIAGEVEEQLANQGHIVISNSKNHRWDKFVPLLIPEVNHNHLELIKHQKFNGGAIVTNPNCSTIGLVIALKPLIDAFGLSDVNVVTMQALSGAGYPGVSSLDILDNVIPFISGEEEKLESEPKKILGTISKKGIELGKFKISAQTHRVAVKDGHLEAVQVNLKKKVDASEIIEVWNRFSSLPQKLKLHSAPLKPIHYFEENNYPQPRLHRDIDKGMAVSVGRLRNCNLFDFKFEVLSHNTVRGAAGGAILCGELMLAQKYF
jgi:aspartate-semialdehyde dehydrogenase